MAATPTPRPRSPRERPSKAPLSERAVIEASLEVLRDEGLEAVTMRRIAKQLDTGAASLYAYVQNREDLYGLVFEEVSGLIPRPAKIDKRSWRRDLRQLLVDTREVFMEYPGIASVALARIPTGPNSLALADTLMGLLLAGKVAPQRAAWASDILFLIVTADAVETDLEAAAVERGTDMAAMYAAVRAKFVSLPPDRYPYLAEHAMAMTTGSGDERFGFAIDTFIAGVLAG